MFGNAFFGPYYWGDAYFGAGAGVGAPSAITQGINDLLRTYYQQSTGLSGLALNDLELVFLRTQLGITGLTSNDIWKALLGYVPNAAGKLNYVYSILFP